MLDKMTRVNNKRMARIIASDKGTMAQNYSYNDWYDILAKDMLS